MKSRALDLHLAGEVARQNLGEAGHVIDILFGIESGELAAEFGEAVDDFAAHTTHSGIKGTKQTHRPSTDDSDIIEFGFVQFVQEDYSRSPIMSPTSPANHELLTARRSIGKHSRRWWDRA